MVVHVVLDLEAAVSLADLHCFLEFSSFLDDPTQDLRIVSANDRSVALVIPLTPREEKGTMRDPDWTHRPGQSQNPATAQHSQVPAG
jgi:hypothetical protein